jgi:hypothetical protein
MDWKCGSSIEHVLCKGEDLSSNPGLSKKKKKRQWIDGRKRKQ